MTTTASSPTLADRNEIHKSCKNLEVVVNILNDYCEAANAIVLLQKKLAKAIRETAGSKCVAEIPANALNTSATVFETLAEVDVKFAKSADKECDAISAEVKKWFKKLAKEERVHDDRLANANAKIKQAGQLFEKKSKRNPQDAAGEHTRYMNLLGTLGPEVNQEKYNHALLVTQRHSSTMYSLAACLSRVADSEWLRSCEGVRKFSPTVGRLGEWRALCEGGWSGAVPADLPDADAQNYGQQNTSEGDRRVGQELAVPSSGIPAPEYSSRQTSGAATPLGHSPRAPPQYLPESGGPTSNPPTDALRELQDAKSRALGKNKNDTLTSITSLSSFPSPPTHFPLPPVTRRDSDAVLITTTPETKADPQSESRTSSGLTPFPRMTDSPTAESPSENFDGSLAPPDMSTTTQIALSSSAPANRLENAVEEPMTLTTETTNITTEHSPLQPPSPLPRNADVGKPRSGDRSVLGDLSGSYKTRDYVGDAEFGVHPTRVVTKEEAKASNREISSPKNLERSDTSKSNGSTVAALRDRYVRTAGATSPRWKEVPRFSGSVSNLAVRYESPGAVPPSPRSGAGSSSDERRHMSLDSTGRVSDVSLPERSGATGRYVPTDAALPVSDINLRRQRIEELEELELREKEYELRMQEREIEHRAQELELQRVLLVNARRPDGYTSDSSRGTATRFAPRPLPDSPSSAPALQPRYPMYSYSTTHLVPQSSNPASASHYGSSQPSSPVYRPTDHSTSCGCEACSVSKYRSADPSPTLRSLRPPAPPITLRPEKPKGWIRRLSMPVISNISAFSLDSKKNISSAGIAGGPGSRNSYALPDEDGRLQSDLRAGIRNRSSTNLARR
ncbi:hypothetical protein BKA93DRAFT_747540 [Sparassis latifolia]